MLGIQIEEQGHQQFSIHADVEHQLQAGCAQAGEQKHQKSRQEQMGRFLLDPNHYAGNHHGDDRSEGQQGVDNLCPRRSRNGGKV